MICIVYAVAGQRRCHLHAQVQTDSPRRHGVPLWLCITKLGPAGPAEGRRHHRNRVAAQQQRLPKAFGWGRSRQIFQTLYFIFFGRWNLKCVAFFATNILLTLLIFKRNEKIKMTQLINSDFSYLLFICLARCSTIHLPRSRFILSDTVSMLCRFLSWSVCRRSTARRIGGCWDSCWWLKSATVAPSRSWTRRNANTQTTWTKATTSPTFWSRRERGGVHFWFVFKSGCTWSLASLHFQNYKTKLIIKGNKLRLKLFV